MIRIKNSKFFLLAVIILIFSLSELFLFSKSYLFGDEIIHYKTISDLLTLNISQDTFFRDAKLPGYFIAIAALSKIFGISSIFGTRIISYILSLFCVFVFFKTANAIDKNNSRIKTVEFFFFPIISIFFYLIYTDIFSLLLLLISFYFIIKKKVLIAAIPGILSVLVRQNNIIWLMFFCLFAARDYNLKKRSELKAYLKQISIFILGFLGFSAFVIINKGISLGQANKIAQPISIHSENIFFFLLLTFFFFLPGIISEFKPIIQRLKHMKYMLFILIMLSLYLLTFKADHIWNSSVFDYYLRNRILDLILKTDLRKIIFFIPIAVSTLYLITTAFNKNVKNLFYSFTLIFLALSWLIDPRYYIIPFSFFLIFKKEQSRRIELISIIMYIALSIIILFNTLNGSFFI